MEAIAEITAAIKYRTILLIKLRQPELGPLGGKSKEGMRVIEPAKDLTLIHKRFAIERHKIINGTGKSL